MKPRIDPDTIAKAMKAAAVVAKTGTREERSGKFIAPSPGHKAAPFVSKGAPTAASAAISCSRDGH